jgi:ribosomal protein S27AE
MNAHATDSGIRLGGLAAVCPQCGSLDVFHDDAALQCGRCGHEGPPRAFRQGVSPRDTPHDRPPIVAGHVLPVFLDDD